MDAVTLELDNYVVSLNLLRGNDVDAVSLSSLIPALNGLDAQAIVNKLTSLGCVDINVLPL
jgi:hypothetical protein